MTRSGGVKVQRLLLSYRYKNQQMKILVVDDARERQIIINECSYQKVKESFICNKVGEVILKNKAKPEILYEVLD